MRILDPEVAQERKHSILQWIIHHFISTSKPISSQMVAEEGAFSLSSATIRNVLKELEEEGFLFQQHTSAGRIPTDKGYRFYVDSLMGIQRLAADEKERIHRQYQRRTEEMDQLLAQTSRMLSSLSHSAGFVLSPKMDGHEIKRLEIIPLEGKRCLIILVAHSGMIRHWPIELPFEVPAQRLSVLNRFLNDLATGRSIRDVQLEFLRRIEAAERELKEVGALAKDVLREVSSQTKPEELFLEGTSNILSAMAGNIDFKHLRDLARILEEKKRFAGLLHRQMEEFAKSPSQTPGARVRVHIGEENLLPELRELSVITTTYELQDRTVGILGIVGPKRMEYPKMVALVDFASSLVKETLDHWETLMKHGTTHEKQRLK